MSVSSTTVSDKQIVGDGRPAGVYLWDTANAPTNADTLVASTATTTSIATEVNKLSAIITGLIRS